MFLSKKLLIKPWAPKVDEIYSTSSSTAASSTISGVQPVYVGDNKLYYSQSDYFRCITLSDAAGSQTDITGRGMANYSEADSAGSDFVIYGALSQTNSINFYKATINRATEDVVVDVVTKNWAHGYARIMCMFNSDIMWYNYLNNNFTLNYNENVIASGAYTFAGKPNQNIAYVTTGGVVYSANSTTVSPVVSTASSSTVYRNGYFYKNYVDGTFYIVCYNANGQVWSRAFYDDEDNTIPRRGIILGTYNNKMYVVTFPYDDSLTSTSKFYRMTLIELDSVTGAIYNDYPLPMPKMVSDGMFTLYQALYRNLNGFGIDSKNGKFALPFIVGYTRNYVFYHDWFVITIPD